MDRKCNVGIHQMIFNVGLQTMITYHQWIPQTRRNKKQRRNEHFLGDLPTFLTRKDGQIKLVNSRLLCTEYKFFKSFGGRTT